MSESVYDKARELARSIKESDYALEVERTRNVFDADKQAQQVLFDYSDLKERYTIDLKEGNMSEEEKKARLLELDEATRKLRDNEVVAEMMRAEGEYNRYVDLIFGIINATLTGNIQSGGCSGDCSGCAGCR